MTEPDPISQPRRHRALLLDSNVLLVLVVGRYSEDLLESFKRTNHYNGRDFQRVQAICRSYERSKSLLTTPHILTEVSNMLSQLGAPADQECRKGLSSFVTLANERFVEARLLAIRTMFARFGITDAGLEWRAEEDTAASQMISRSRDYSRRKTSQS